MATTRTRTDRVADWLLDVDGDMYGDEQERLRWYEGISIAATVQWLIVPWVLAGLIWVQGRPVAVPVLLLALAFYLPMFLTNGYVARRRVRTGLRWDRKRLLVTLLVVVPYAGIISGLLHASDLLTGAVGIGVLLGAVVGGLAGWLLARIRARRRGVPESDVDPGARPR